MIRDDVKIIITPTGVSLKEVLTKEVVKALNDSPYSRDSREEWVGKT